MGKRVFWVDCHYRIAHDLYYSFVWGPLKHDQKTVCRWIKCSDAMPEGCHYLLETLTATYFQMAGCMPLTQWKFYYFLVITTRFISAMQDEVGKALLEWQWLKPGWCRQNWTSSMPTGQGKLMVIPPKTPQSDLILLIFYFISLNVEDT